MATLASGCAITGRGTERVQMVPVDTSCSWARPIFVSGQDVLTDQTAKAILAHNETGAKRCGWKRRVSATAPAASGQPGTR